MKVRYRIALTSNGYYRVQTKGMYSLFTWYNNIGANYFETLEEAERWIKNDIDFEKRHKEFKKRLNKPIIKIIKEIEA